jgi:parallel beta-helix repeat protein
MNDQHALEREVEAWIDAEAWMSLPEQTLSDILVATGRKRPLPRWLALIKEPPMRISSNVAIGSPMTRVAAILVATLLLALTVAGAGIAGSRLLAADGTIVVAQDGSGTHATITEAVEAANDGDTILVKPGTYVEAVIIAKDIALIGDGPRDQIVIENPPDGPMADGEALLVDDADRAPHFALLVDDADATIAGLTLSGPRTGGVTAIVIGGAPTLDDISVILEGPPGTYQYWAALYILGGSRPHVVGSELHGYVSIEDGSSPTIEDTAIAGQLYLDGAVDAVLRGDTFSTEPRSSYRGVIVAGSTGIFEGNDLAAGALEIRDGSDVVVRDNTLGGLGVTVMGEGTTASITGNTVTSSQMRGIDVGPGAEATIEGNTITGGSAGLALASDAVRVEGNTITGARTGILVTGDAAPTITGNSFCDNEQDLVVPEGSTLVLDPSNEVCPA